MSYPYNMIQNGSPVEHDSGWPVVEFGHGAVKHDCLTFIMHVALVHLFYSILSYCTVVVLVPTLVIVDSNRTCVGRSYWIFEPATIENRSGIMKNREIG